MGSIEKGCAIAAGFIGANGHGDKLLEEDSSSKIKHAIAECERQLGEVRTELNEAKRKRTEAEAVRHQALFAAKVERDPEARARLNEATAALEAAQRAENDLLSTIPQLESLVTELKQEWKGELKIAERREIEAQ